MNNNIVNMETKFLLSIFCCVIHFGSFNSEFVTKEDYDDLRHDVQVTSIKFGFETRKKCNVVS